MVFASKEAAEKYAKETNGVVVECQVMHHTEEVIVYKVVRKDK